MSHATRPNQTTKKKALRDIVAVVEGRPTSFSPNDDTLNDVNASVYKRSPEVVAAALPQWHRAFARLADDDSAATRVLAAEANAALCENAKKGLAFHLKHVTPTWFANAHDEDPAVVKAAKESFERVFATPEKRSAVLARYAREILRRVVEKLAPNSDDDKNENGGTSEERRERSERITSAALRTLAGFARVADVRDTEVSVALGEALDKLDVQNNGGGLKRFAKHSCAKIRRGAYVATLAIADAEGSYFETNDVLGDAFVLRRQSFASVALLDATDERDGSSLGEARELALGFLRRRGDDAWKDLGSFLLTEQAREGDAPGDEPPDSIDAFLGTLERHVSSGCHGAAEQSAPSVLPLLAATPLHALRKKNRLVRLLAALWDGYGLCDVPSRSADAKALLQAFRETLLYGTIVVAVEDDASNDVTRNETENKDAERTFRDDLFRAALEERWVPCAMRDLDDCTENAVSLRAAWLCETLVSVSRRPALKETCLRRVMERVVEDCARTVAGSIPGGGVDAPGARRVAAFHRALCSAAETRDASDAKKKGNDDSETALRWVERAFARPVAVATATAVASGGPTEAGAALLASLVEKHGASCLTPGDVAEGDDASASASLVDANLDGLLDACFAESSVSATGTVSSGDARRGRSTKEARAETLATVVLAAPGAWDEALRRASESAARGDASGLATVAAALEILGKKPSSSSWRRPALDAIVVDAATAKDARDRLGPEASALVAAAAATASVTPAAAAAIARNLASAVAGAAAAGETDAARDASEAAEAWAWPPPSSDDGDATDAWLGLVTALFGARLDGETRRRGDGGGGDERRRAGTQHDLRADDGEGEGSGSDDDAGSETASETDSDDSFSSGSNASEEEEESDDASLSDGEGSDGGRRSLAPASATWARVERLAARGARDDFENAEAAARDAFVAETSRRLEILETETESSRASERERVDAARRLAPAAASALAAFGADADDAATAAAGAALAFSQKTQSGKSDKSFSFGVCRAAFLDALASLFGSWAPFLAAADAADARDGKEDGFFVARLLEAGYGEERAPSEENRHAKSSYARRASRGVARALASALASAPFDADGEKPDPFVSAVGALVRDAVDAGVERDGASQEHGRNKPSLPPRIEAALAALRANADVYPPNAASRSRARAIFQKVTAGRFGGATSAAEPLDAKTSRALARVVPLTRVSECLPIDDDASKTDDAFDAFAATCAARAKALLSRAESPREKDDDDDDALGPAVALAAACYSRDAVRSAKARDDDDAAASASDERITLESSARTGRGPGACPEPLLDLVRAVTRREAASAAAARFAKLNTNPPNASADDSRVEKPKAESSATSEPEENDAAARKKATVDEERAEAFARLSVAAVERCAASLDARDWELIIDRTRRLFAARVASGEDQAERRAEASCSETDSRKSDDEKFAKNVAEHEASPPAGWRSAAAGARLLLRLENLPVVVAPPDPATGSEGDVVPFGAQGAGARHVAEHLARAAWPSARADAHASLARALMAAGAERRHARGFTSSGDAQWRLRRRGEGRLWSDAAALWSTASGAAAVAAAAPWDAMDHWEEARCGAVAALYETLLCADALDLDSKDPDDHESSTRVDACLSALRRASYALLSSPALVKPAVVGFDSAVADVEAVEAAALDAPSDSDDEESEDSLTARVSRGEKLADRAALREPLAEKLLRKEKDVSTVSPVSTKQRDVSTLLCWALFLKHLGGLDGSASDKNAASARERLAMFARDADAVSEIMRLALRWLPMPSSSASLESLPSVWRDAAQASMDAGRDGAGGGGAAVAAAAADSLSPEFLFSSSARSTRRARRLRSSRRFFERLALGAYRACLSALPALTRTWFSDLKDTKLAKALETATSCAISPFLLEREFDVVERAATGAYSGFSFGEHDGDSTGTLTVKVSRNVREISATYSVEDANVQLLIKLPKAYPLVAAELTTGSRAGVSEARARKWSLAVGAILRHQNGAVAAGLATWRANVDREFAGVEPCPICYLVIHGANHTLPRLRCGQCRNKFHNACLYKWFTSSSKSTCPLCQTPWGASYRG